MAAHDDATSLFTTIGGLAGQATSSYAKCRMIMRFGNARYSADPDDISAQSDLICVPQLMILGDSPAVH